MKRLASWLLLSLASAIAPAQDLGQKLDEVFKAWDRKDAPGGIVSVSVKGQVVYTKAFGMANLETGTPNTLGTIFDVGSVSKQFTAACVLLLQDDGKLKIDDQASIHLPDYPVLSEHKITVRQLMDHTSGLRDYLSLIAFKTGKAAFEDAEIVEVLQRQRTLNFAPGATWDYSNSGYYLLKKLVEKLSGKSLAEFAKERLFDPLGMKDTRFLDDATKLIPGRAFGYVPVGESVYHAGITTIAADGAGGLWTTLEDMHRWTQNWKHNRLGGDREMFRKMQAASKAIGPQMSYGLGFFIDRYRDVPRIQHGGDFIGFHAQVCWYPEQDVVVTTMSNDGTQRAKTLNDRAADVVLGIGPKENADGATELRLTPDELDEYVGTYDLAGRKYEVTREDAQLKAQLAGQPKFDLFAREKDKFFYKVVEARVEFVRDESGTVESLTLFQGGAQIVCKRAGAYVAPDESLKKLVGYYYSTELDLLVSLRIKEDGLYASSPSILDTMRLDAAGENRFSAGPLSVEVDVDQGVVLAIRVTMPRAANMRFERMSAIPPD